MKRLTTMEQLVIQMDSLMREYENNRVELQQKMFELLESMPDNMPQRVSNKGMAIIPLEDETEQ